MTSTASTASADLLRRAEDGDIAATSMLMTALEADTDRAREIRTEVHRAGGNAHVIGITGPAGSGKSVLVGSLVRELRSRGKRVGVVAVDPSSSISGGAILGDRIRMQGLTMDPFVFMRSMSSRGWLGGVSRATVDVVAVLDATGWDTVIVETVGVGQAEVEIVSIAHTVAVVSVPGLGDDIQAIKAGLLEVADVHVVNKSDLPEANKTASELTSMLMLSMQDSGWNVPVLSTAGLEGQGVPELVDTFEKHLDWLRSSGEYDRRERRAAEARISATARDLLIERLRGSGENQGFVDAVDDVVARRRDPYDAALGLIASL
jgi:GTPase